MTDRCGDHQDALNFAASVEDLVKRIDGLLPRVEECVQRVPEVNELAECREKESRFLNPRWDEQDWADLESYLDLPARDHSRETENECRALLSKRREEREARINKLMEPFVPTQADVRGFFARLAETLDAAPLEVKEFREEIEDRFRPREAAHKVMGYWGFGCSDVHHALRTIRMRLLQILAAPSASAARGGQAASASADVASIRYPQQFHELCRDLVHAEFLGAQTFEGAGGDEGVDAYHPDTETIFQFHGPEFQIRKEKLKSYLDKASQHSARRWLLLSKRDLTPGQSAWLDSVRSHYHFAIEVWGPAKLNQLLDKYPGIAERYSTTRASKEAAAFSVGAQNAEQIVNVVGPTTIITRRRGLKTSPIPGSVGSDPFKKGRLAKLIERLAEFRAWDIGEENMRSIYPTIHKNYLRDKGCRVNDTPLERFDEAVSYFEKKIDNTKLGRINRGKGHPNY